MATSQSQEVLAVAILFSVLSWLAVGLRVWVRTRMISAFGHDDWAMLACQLLFTGYLVSQLGGWVYGTGQHFKDLEPWRARRALCVRQMRITLLSSMRPFR
jgi:hypothetical protein